MAVFKVALETIKTLVEIINTISDIGVIKKLGEKFGENVTKADVRDWRYRLTGKVSDADEALFIRAQNELNAEGKAGSVLAFNQTAATKLTSEMQDRFRLKMLGLFDPADKDQAEEAVKHIKATIELYAQLPDPAWDDLKKILNLDATTAQTKWERFYNWASANLSIIGQSIKDAGNAVVAKRDEINKEIEATGVVTETARFRDWAKKWANR